MNFHFTWLMAAVIAFGVCGVDRPVAAQAAGEREVTAVGGASISAQPELLRVTVELRGEGPGAKEALAKLAAVKQSVREKVAPLSIPSDAIKFGDPMLGEGPLNAQQQQIRMMMNMRGQKKPTTTKALVTVSSVMTIEIALKSSTPDELLLTAADLQEKLGSAFKAPPKALTPEEREVMEEMQGAEEAANAGKKPGEPTFLYVHKISEVEQQKAMADAFSQAQQSATRLAKAASAQLGDVRSLTAGSMPMPGSDDENPYAALFAGMAGQRSANGTVLGEATSQQPGPVTSRLTVTAVFTLK